MKKVEIRRSYSKDTSKSKANKVDYSNSFSLDVNHSSLFCSQRSKKNLRSTRSPIGEIEKNIGKQEKSIENFSKLSEMLAEAQSDILGVLEKGFEKAGGKTKLWEIFTYLNNKIWAGFFKNPQITQEEVNVTIEALKKEIKELEQEKEKTREKLNEYENFNFPSKMSEYEALLLNLSVKNRKQVEELNQLTKEYLQKDEKIKEILENSTKSKKEHAETLHSKSKELTFLHEKLSETQKERDSLLHWKSNFSNDQLEKSLHQKNVLEKENKNLKEQLLSSRQNFENLEKNTLELQEKFFKQCQAYDHLGSQYRDVLGNSNKKKRSKSKSIGSSKGLIRQNFSPITERSAKKNKNLLRIEVLKTNVEVLPNFFNKNLIELKEAKISQLGMRLEELERENKAIEAENNLKQSEFEKKSKLLLKEIGNYCEEKNALEGTLGELREKYRNNAKDLEISNGKVQNLSSSKAKIEQELETSKKKIISMQKYLDSVSQEKENFIILQKNYQSQIEDLQSKSTNKDTASLQKELKYAKSLVIRNQAEVNKLHKERESLNKELFEVKCALEGKEDEKKNEENMTIEIREKFEEKEKQVRSELNEKIKGLETTVQSLLCEINNLSEAETKLKLRFKAESSEIIEKLSRELESLKQEISCLKYSHEQEINEITRTKNQEIFMYTSKISEMNTKSPKKNHEENCEFEETSKRLEKELKEKHQEIISLQESENKLMELNYGLNKEYQAAIKELILLKGDSQKISMKTGGADQSTQSDKNCELFLVNGKSFSIVSDKKSKIELEILEKTNEIIELRNSLQEKISEFALLESSYSELVNEHRKILTEYEEKSKQM